MCVLQNRYKNKANIGFGDHEMFQNVTKRCFCYINSFNIFSAGNAVIHFVTCFHYVLNMKHLDMISIMRVLIIEQVDCEYILCLCCDICLKPLCVFQFCFENNERTTFFIRFSITLFCDNYDSQNHKH